MQEILRTNNPVLISYVRSQLLNARIESVESTITSLTWKAVSALFPVAWHDDRGSSYRPR